MNILAITVTEAGVLRTDMLIIEEKDYPGAVEFQHKLSGEISRLDTAIKEKFKQPAPGGHHPE